MTDSSPEAEFGDVYDWEPPTSMKEVLVTDRDQRALDLSTKRSTASSQRKSSGGASQPSRKPLVDLLPPSELQQRLETIENTRKISEQRQEKRKSWQFDRTSKSTSSALRRKESSSFVSTRKPSPSQRSDATQLSSKPSVASSSANRKRTNMYENKKISVPLMAINAGVSAANGGDKGELLQSAMNREASDVVEDFFMPGNEMVKNPVTYGETLRWTSKSTFQVIDDNHAMKVLRLGELETSVKFTLLRLNGTYIGPEPECPRSIKNVPSEWRINHRDTNAPFTPDCDASTFKAYNKEKKRKENKQKRVFQSNVVCKGCGRGYVSQDCLARHHKKGSARRMKEGKVYPACKGGVADLDATSAYRQR